MIADINRRSLLMRKLIAFAAILLAFGFTGCGEKEQKASSVPVPAPGASTPSPAAGAPAPVAEAPKASTTIRAAQPVSSAIGKIDALEDDVRIVDRRGERRARAGQQQQQRPPAQQQPQQAQPQRQQQRQGQQSQQQKKKLDPRDQPK